jgi:hypothetical protein
VQARKIVWGASTWKESLNKLLQAKKPVFILSIKVPSGWSKGPFPNNKPRITNQQPIYRTL